jgi:hypothetical protein
MLAVRRISASLRGGARPCAIRGAQRRRHAVGSADCGRWMRTRGSR